MAVIVGGFSTGILWGGLQYYTIKNPKTFQVGHIYIQSSNTNSPGIIKTSQKIERLNKTCAFALDDCIYTYLTLNIFGCLNVINSKMITSRGLSI